MKTIALLCMLVDHIGLMFFPQHILWRMIGRLAMPIFAFGIARGAYYTSSMSQYIKKMLIFALISQIPYWWVETLALGEPFPSLNFNVGFTFLGALLILAQIQKSQNEVRNLHMVEILMITLILLLSDLLGFDYGSYGILLVLMCYIIRVKARGRDTILLLMLGYTILTYLLYLGHIEGFMLQEIGVLGFIIVKQFESISEKKIGGLFYIFYPIHLLVLCLIKWLM